MKIRYSLNICWLKSCLDILYFRAKYVSDELLSDKIFSSKIQSGNFTVLTKHISDNTFSNDIMVEILIYLSNNFFLDSKCNKKYIRCNVLSFIMMCSFFFVYKQLFY